MNIQTLFVFAAVAALAITIITVNMAYATSDRIDTKDPLQNYNQSSAQGWMPMENPQAKPGELPNQSQTCIGCANPPAPTEEVMNIGNLTK
jgi:hypothetical protein